MRLDKYISQVTNCTRSESKKIIKTQLITVNDVKISSINYQIKLTDNIFLNGKQLYQTTVDYILLNKPKGYICSLKDEHYPSILNLIDIPNKKALRIGGRLDQDTTGLLLLSTNGQWLHQLNHPKKSCYKKYLVTIDDELTLLAQEQLENGLYLRGETAITLPARVKIKNKHQYTIEIQEGRYHQIKRMFAAVGYQVVALHRLTIGDIQLPEYLVLGEWMVLDPP